MSDSSHSHDPSHAETPVDQEIDVRGILRTGIALAVLVFVSMLLMWWLFVGIKKAEESRNPPPSPLPELSERQMPPFPRLQAEPEEELKQLHTEENRVLGSYGWVDRGQGVVRIPVEKALVLLGERGLPVPPPPATLL
ncbi:MAG TPA: hypothetical protein PK413_14740, partial [Thermoanaerobaculia bacterium]|nr:hypothetical protein [Thermoanaerobaculia bacterium]